jgi:UDP-N-acetylmuramate dehydrogenase
MFKNELEYKLIGETSNLLFLDDRNYGVLLSLCRLNRMNYHSDVGQIMVEAGTNLPEFTRRALVWGLTGFEGLEGIPGTLGGAVVMNAGAYDCEIKDQLTHIHALRKDGSLCELSCDELRLTNRNSLLKEQNGEYIVLRAFFSAVRGDPRVIFDRMELLHAKRHRYQDFIYPTLGSLFSNIELYSALGHSNCWYRILLRPLVILLYSKKFRRETPINRRRLNVFVCRYFGWRFDVQPFSDKTMNCITNRGQHTDQFVEYIEMLRKHLPSSIRLENEIMDSYFCGE